MICGDQAQFGTGGLGTHLVARLQVLHHGLEVVAQRAHERAPLLGRQAGHELVEVGAFVGHARHDARGHVALGVLDAEVDDGLQFTAEVSERLRRCL